MGQPAQPASLAVLAWDESKLTCRLTGSPARAYHVERSSDLATWVVATTVTTDANGVATFDRPGSAPSEFLRARTAP